MQVKDLLADVLKQVNFVGTLCRNSIDRTQIRTEMAPEITLTPSLRQNEKKLVFLEKAQRKSQEKQPCPLYPGRGIPARKTFRRRIQK